MVSICGNGATILVVILAIALLTPHEGWAASAKSLDAYLADMDRCIEDADGRAIASGADNGGRGVSRCSIKIVKELDKILNKKYKSLVMSVDNKNRSIIINSERQWILAKNKECGLENNENILTDNQANCVASELVDRIRWVDSYKNID